MQTTTPVFECMLTAAFMLKMNNNRNCTRYIETNTLFSNSSNSKRKSFIYRAHALASEQG